MNYITISNPNVGKVTLGKKEGIEKLDNDKYLID